jgi:hypothetical protein
MATATTDRSAAASSFPQADGVVAAFLKFGQDRPGLQTVPVEVH